VDISPQTLTSGIRAWSVGMSSIRGGIARPSGRPFQSFERSPGQQIARHSPNASRSRIVTVPHAIEAIVRKARFFWRRAEPKKRWRTTPRSLRIALIAGGSQLHRHDGVEPRSLPGREVAREKPRRPEHDRGQCRHRKRYLGIAHERGRAELRHDEADRERDQETDR